MGRRHGRRQGRQGVTSPVPLRGAPSSGAQRELGVSRSLARFIATSRASDIPPDVADHVVNAVLNGFGTALGGASDTAIARLAATLGAAPAAGSCTVIGRSGRADMAGAAFLNAAAMNVFDFDDTHIPTIIHPTAPVVPAVLALAEARGSSGAEVLHATALGIEVACRLGNAVSPGHYERGWHITSTCGIFGAAAACAKLLGLDEERIVWTFGNAAAQASGLVETLGFMAKSVGVGGAARNGLASALMAAGGVEGPPHPIEGPRGFLKVTCDAPKPEAVTDGLGSHWETLRVMFKPYACGVVLNPVIDACLTARREHAVQPDAVRSIRIRGNPLLKARADRPDVTTGREAQVSAQHAVAACLLRGGGGAAEFSDAAVGDAQIAALRGKVGSIETDPAIPIEAVQIVFEVASGETVTVREENATGTLGRPMSDAALSEKFAALAAHGSPQIDSARLEKALRALPSCADIRSVLALAC